MSIGRSSSSAVNAIDNLSTLVDPKELDRLYEFERVLGVKFKQIDVKS